MVTIPGLDNPIDTKEITRAWINAQGTMETLDRTGYPSPHHDSGKVTHVKLLSELTNARSCAKEELLPGTNAASLEKSLPGNSVTGNTPLFGLQGTNPFASTPTDDFTTVNERLVATLARQNLPKCHPDIFTGDATLFHPWKSAFRAMLKDANVSPDQEIKYLRSYTKGDAQEVINNYRQRQYRNPADALRDVWKELERRFGNTAAISNVLLVRLQTAAKFGEDSDKLQAFADVCADVDSQLDFLPVLGCLNYLTAIGPIVENLPHFLRSKWDKRVVQHAEKYDDAYPSFKGFAAMAQDLL